jgi:HK97 family phage portal protein
LIINYLKNIFTGIKNKRLYKQLVSILNDGRAIFSSFGDNVYLSDFVNNCIDRIATEISKINIISVAQKPGSIKQLNDDITKLFRFKPNSLQTTKDFLACCEWLRRKDCNCFIYPQYMMVADVQGNQYRKYIAFYPLNPTQIEIGVDTENNNVWEIKFYWRDGTSDILPYADLVHLRWRRGKNTIVGGGDDYGRPDTRDLLSAVDTLHKVMEGLPKGIESSLKIRGIYTAKTVLDADKLKAARDDFESHVFDSKTGIVATDLAGEFAPLDMKAVEIKSEVMTFLKSIIRDRYGISEAILSGDYTGDQHSAFYQNCLEDFIVEFEQAMSSCLFTVREQDVGHRIKCYYDKVAYLSTQNKIEIANLSTNTGLMTLNEIADAFGMAPFDGGDRRLQSLNYVNVELIDKYQLSNSGAVKVTDSNSEGKGDDNDN